MMKILTLILTLIAGAQLMAGEAKVIVHLLDHTEKKECKERFWIDWCDNWRGIVETKAVEGAAAKALIAEMKKSLREVPSKNMCGHDPIYGIEVTYEDGSALKTSLCFSCNTWVKPKTRMSIAGGHGINNPLCLALRKVIELPAELLPQPKTD